MIDIKDFRIISEVMQSKYRININGLAFTIYRRRISNALNNLKFKSVDSFIHNIQDNNDLAQKFLFEISVSETEMFRDPEVWRMLKESVLPKIYKSSEFTIWFPEATTGEELYSFVIMLLELDYYKYAKIIVSNASFFCLEKIQEGVFSKKTYDINNANYIKSGGDKDFSNYLSFSGNSMKINSTLKQNISYVNQDTLSLIMKDIDLVIYRNKMLYYNKDSKSLILNHLYASLKDNGFFVGGINESLVGENNEFKDFDKYNSIYIK